MKRSYLSVLAKSVLGLAILASGAVASAQTDFAPLKPQDEAAPHNTVRVESPISKALHRQKPSTAKNEVLPVLDGLHRTPGRAVAKSTRPASILRSPQAPRGNIYGVVNRYDGMEYRYQAYVGKLNLNSGILAPMYRNSVFCPYTADDYVYQGNSYRNGQIICMKFEEGINKKGEETYLGRWDLVDIETGEITQTIHFDEQLADGYSIAYNPDLDVFFVISIDMINSGGDSILGIVDPNGEKGWVYHEGGRLETSRGGKPYIACIAYNPVDKTLYAFDNDNTVYTVEWEGPDGIEFPETRLVEYGTIYLPDDGILFFCDTTDPIAGQVTYSPTDEMFVAVYRDNDNRKNRVVYIDPETLEGTFGTDITSSLGTNKYSMFVTSIFCTDDFASSDAPMLAEDPEIYFVKEALNGKIQFVVPSESFVGVSLEGSDLEAVAKIDGNVVDQRKVKAGETYVLDITLEQGEHTLEYTTAIGENVSPVNTTTFYVGYDAPQAPGNIKLDGTLLSWSKPGAVGAHKGYVDVDDITYDVYLDNVKQNSAPLTETSFSIPVPSTMSRSTISVRATSRGQQSPAASINEIFGKSFELPFVQAPSSAQSYLYTIENANNDVRSFYYGTNMGKYEGMVFVTGYIEDADDWLFLPAINFPDSSKLYTFEFDIRGVYDNLETAESFEVYVSKKADSKSAKAGTQIYANYNFPVIATNPKHQTFSFGVPEAGDYYLAIRVVSTRDQSSQGMSFHDFTVKTKDGSSSVVPGEPTNVKVTPMQFGEQGVTVEATIPTVDILGNPLPADMDVTLTLSFSNERNEVFSKTATGKPGENVTIIHGGDRDGIIYYTLTPSNANGEGYTRTYPVYVGIDVPYHPDNIKGVPAKDNMSIHLTWDAPGSVGRNGGFVGVDELKYRIYTLSGVTYLKVEDTSDLEYTYYPYGKTATKGRLESWHVGPAAFNEAGESIESEFVQEVLGTPYELPMYEEWNSTSFSYYPLNFMNKGVYAGSTWMNSMSSYGLGIGDPTVKEGAIYTYGEYPCKTKLILPKATTAGIGKAIVSFKIWDYAKGVKSIQLYGRCSDNPEEQYIGEFKFNNPAKGTWVDAEIPLTKEFCDQQWVQLRLESTLTGKDGEYLLLDSFTFMPDADYDLKVTVFDGLTNASVGDEMTFNASVANAGRERIGGNLFIELVDPEGNTLLSEPFEVAPLNAGQSADYEATFTIDGSFRDFEKITARGRIEVEDENTANNIRGFEVTIQPTQLPVINDLKAEVDDNGNAVLDWTAPTATYGNFENFEAYKPFRITDKIGYWQNIDMNGDEKLCIWGSDATGTPVVWENSEEPCAWQVYDYRELNMNDARVRPHSGNKAIMARSLMGDENGNVPQASKWLVSPEIVPSSTLSFWWSTLMTDYTEYVEIWVSEADPSESYLNPNDPYISMGRCGTFRKKQSFSKLGSESWENTVYMFDRRARQFAIRYCSYDSFCVVFDDINFTPANMLTRTAASYDVYRMDNDGSEPELIAQNITDTHFVDNNYNDHGYSYYVVANADVDGVLTPGASSNVVRLISLGVGDVTAAQSVTAGKGVVNINGFAGEEAVIAAADGKVVRKATVNGSHAAYAVEKGIYLVTVGKKTYKVVVK